MPKKLRWLRSPTGSNGRPWKNWRLSRNRIRCWPGTESSSPTSSTDRSFANPGVVRELTRKPSGWWCGWRRKIPGGADRIVGAMANLGHRLSDQTVGNILRRHDIPPAPKRKQTTSWKDFIRAHMAVLVATDCRWRWKKGPKQRWSGYFSLCPFPSWKGCSLRTARSGQGRAGVARRSEPFTARTVLRSSTRGKGVALNGPLTWPSRSPPPTLHQIQPTGTGRHKVAYKAGMLLQPRLHVRLFVRAVVVHH